MYCEYLNTMLGYVLLKEYICIITDAMTYPSKVRDFVVGIDYNAIEEDRSHMAIRWKVVLDELAEEIKELIQNGCHYPQFPPEANPSITYAWDLSNQDDGDCYHEIMSKLEKDDRKDVIY